MTRRIIPILLICIGIPLVILPVGYLLAGQLLEKPRAPQLPTRLVGLPLTRNVSGQSAMDEINRLHGIDFSLSYGLVGSYGNDQVILWVSGSIDPQAASQMVIDMRDRIAEGRSPFTSDGVRTIDKRPVYELTGLGQKHFYFQAGTQVIWLAADPALAEQALQQALQFFLD